MSSLPKLSSSIIQPLLPNKREDRELSDTAKVFSFFPVTAISQRNCLVLYQTSELRETFNNIHNRMIKIIN